MGTYDQSLTLAPRRVACSCGHSDRDHVATIDGRRVGPCIVLESRQPLKFCNCNRFRAMAEESRS